jgi:hypothetical protein
MKKPKNSIVTRKQLLDQRKLLNEVGVFHSRLMAAGLITTGHKMHEVVREAGYEFARQREKDSYVVLPEKSTR